MDAYVWDANTGEEILGFKQPGEICHVQYAQNGELIRVDVGRRHGDLETSVRSTDFFNATTGARMPATEPQGSVSNLAYSSRGKTIATVSRDDSNESSKVQWSIQLWNTETGALRETFTARARVIRSLAFSHDDHVLAAAVVDIARKNSRPSDMSIMLFDARNGMELRTIETPNMIRKLLFTPDGGYIISANSRGPGPAQSFTIWDKDSGATRRTVPARGTYFTSFATSPDGRHIVSGSGDNLVKIWEVGPSADAGQAAANSKQ